MQIPPTYFGINIISYWSKNVNILAEHFNLLLNLRKQKMTAQPFGHTVTLFILFGFCDFSVKDITHLSRRVFLSAEYLLVGRKSAFEMYANGNDNSGKRNSRAELYSFEYRSILWLYP